MINWYFWIIRKYLTTREPAHTDRLVDLDWKRARKRGSHPVYRGGGGAIGAEWGKKGGWFSFTLLLFFFFFFFFCWRQCGQKIDTSEQKYLDPPENLETLLKICFPFLERPLFETWRWKFRKVSSFFVDKEWAARGKRRHSPTLDFTSNYWGNKLL